MAQSAVHGSKFVALRLKLLTSQDERKIPEEMLNKTKPRYQYKALKFIHCDQR